MYLICLEALNYSVEQVSHSPINFLFIFFQSLPDGKLTRTALDKKINQVWLLDNKPIIFFSLDDGKSTPSNVSQKDLLSAGNSLAMIMKFVLTLHLWMKRGTCMQVLDVQRIDLVVQKEEDFKH